jgi:hypothetical protein
LLHLSATAKPYPSHITIHRKIPLNHSFL